MNAPVETVTLKIGGGTLIVPAEGLARIWLDHQLEPRLAYIPLGTLDDSSIVTAAEKNGWKYAGLTLHNGAPHRLFLLPSEFEGPWQEAMDWAAKQGGGDCVLPSRIDALMLFQNLKKEFKDTWYWTSEPYAHTADYAWIQGFRYGNQDHGHTSGRGRARAVRRVAL